MSHVKSAQRDQPLSGTNQRLETFNTIRTKQGSDIQLRLFILLQRKVRFLGLLAKQLLVCINEASHVDLSAATWRNILVMEDVTTQVTFWFFDVLQLVIPWIRLQLLLERVRILQHRQCVINADNHTLVAITSIKYSCIGFSMGRHKIQCAQSISKLSVNV